MALRIAIGLLMVVVGLALASQAFAKKFQFVALGDTAYNLPDDLPTYERLIGEINKSRPAFSIHVGDLWGALPCDAERYSWIKGWFDKYQRPVVYTPGDNEWTDCRKPEIIAAYLRILDGTAAPVDYQFIGAARQLDNAMAGTSFADTLEKLGYLRSAFFSEPRSLGKRTMPLVRQPDLAEFRDLYPDMVENLRWEKDGVVFGTVHVPGSGMNFTINDSVRATDAIARNEADVAWIQSLFAHATATDAPAVVIALHASLFIEGDGGEFANHALRGGEEGPYFWIASAIRDLAAKFGKPVLLINGDFHDLIIDRPFMVSQGEGKPPKYANITRLQVYGAPELKAVQVTVDTKTPWVFSFSPLY